VPCALPDLTAAVAEFELALRIVLRRHSGDIGLRWMDDVIRSY
jgi:hypothetical protein